MAEWVYNQEDTPNIALNDECKVCEGKRKSHHYALCQKCLYYYHPSCLKMKVSEVMALPLEVPFYCLDCTKIIEEERRKEEEHNGDINSQDTEIIGSQPLSDLSCHGQFNNQDCDHNNDQWNDNRRSQEKSIEEFNHSQHDSVTDIGTDDEGYKEVDYFKDHRVRRGKRQFLAVYKDEEEGWVNEKDCDGSVDFLNIYCRSAGIPETSIEYREGCGATEGRKPDKKLWASIDRIKDMVVSYGNKSALQPKIFSGLNTEEDSLQLMQIGSHCFALLYIAKLKTCFLSDGQNAFINHSRSRKLVMTKLAGVNFLSCLQFYGQKEEDQCASSAAAIAIEFQRLHNIREVPKDPLQVSTGQLDRIRKILHKGSGEKINSWTPIDGQAWKVKCDNCGKTFATKNRGALNLHRCG